MFFLLPIKGVLFWICGDNLMRSDRKMTHPMNISRVVRQFSFLLVEVTFDPF